MQVKSIDIQKTKLRDLISWITAGTELILLQGRKPIARVIPIASALANRIAGLHAGAIWTSTDFDEQLPDEYWSESPAQAI